MAMASSRISSIALVLLCLFLAACGSRDLSRSAAEQVILADEELQARASSITILNGSLEQGVAQGLWDVAGSDVYLREQAQQEIAFVSRDQIQLNSPAAIEVAVTGIAPIGDAETLREVQFDWNYKDLPPITKRFAVRGGTGSAAFRRYDDGWRAERITLKVSPEPFALTDAEIAQIDNDYQAESLRLQKIDNELRAAQEARQKLIDASKAPSKTLGTYAYAMYERVGLKNVITKGTVELTDVGFTISESRGARDRGPKTFYFYDGYVPNEEDYQLKYKRISGIDYKIDLWGKNYTNATWNWKTNVLVVQPYFYYEWETPLRFEDPAERDRFYRDLRVAVNNWGAKHSGLVNFTPLK